VGRDDASCWWVHEAGASGIRDATDGAVRARDRADRVLGRTSTFPPTDEASGATSSSTSIKPSPPQPPSADTPSTSSEQAVSGNDGVAQDWMRLLAK
jgi:hypothetical protein